MDKDSDTPRFKHKKNIMDQFKEEAQIGKGDTFRPLGTNYGTVSNNNQSLDLPLQMNQEKDKVDKEANYFNNQKKKAKYKTIRNSVDLDGSNNSSGQEDIPAKIH